MQKQFFLLIELDKANKSINFSELEQLQDQTKIRQMSLNIMWGQNSPRTILLKGKSKRQHLTILIDGGSTHNFIQHAHLVRFLDLNISTSTQFQVMVNTRG